MPLNQHRVKSEYAKAFKTHQQSAKTEYAENMKFRLLRRNQEVAHQPWAWLDIDLSEDESDLTHSHKSVTGGSDRKALHRRETESDNSTETNSNFDASGAVDIAETEGDGKLIEQLKKRAMKRAKEISNGHSAHQRTNGASQPSQHNQSNSAVPRRPHHPVKGNAGTFQHHKSRNPSNSAINKSEPKTPKDLCSINRDKLFLSYGWGSGTSEGHQKKTFNIKSDIDVYPSALRAFQSRKSVAKQPKESARPRTSGPGKGRNPTVRNIELDNRAAMEWLSEYQFRFPIYDNEVYRRGLANLAPRGQSARRDTPRTCRI